MSNFNKNNYLIKNNHKINCSSKISLLKVENLHSFDYEDDIVTEFPLSLFINGKYEHTFLCSPYQLKELVVGYLCFKNLINKKSDILDFKLSKDCKVAYVEIHDINLPLNSPVHLSEYNFIESSPIKNDNITITANEIYDTMKKNLSLSPLFKTTAGVHCISIYENGTIIVSCEDVARHNAMDKAIGYCILNDIPLYNKIIFISGRISFEMLKKAAQVKIPIVIGKSATTNLVVEIAKKLNITLVGFVRDNKMNIYTNPHRIYL